MQAEPTTEPTLASPHTPIHRPVRRPIRKWLLRLWLTLALLFGLYVVLSYQAWGVEPALLETDAIVRVHRLSDRTEFAPAAAAKPVGLILLPGSLVDPLAYAPLARSIAAEGYRVVLIELPWRMASSDPDRDAVVARVMEQIGASGPGTRWLVAGHSLGGAIAARAARDHADRLAGVILIGTSHPRDFDLSHVPIDVTQITASHDGLASPDEVRANANKLPATTRRIVIAGGNHSQFGCYGFQLGDGRATISRADQQRQTQKAILDALGQTR